MAAPSKKRIVESKDGTSESSSEGESDTESYNGQEIIQADFEGRNPEIEDYDGIRQLLQQLFLKAQINLSDMTEIILDQTGIGSVLKQSNYGEDDTDEEESDILDVFGVTTVINLTLNKDKQSVQQLNTFINTMCQENGDHCSKQRVNGILENKNTIGLLINERFINIPPKISDPLLTTLMVELNKIKNKDSSYHFDYIIAICKIHKPKTGDIMFSNEEEIVFDGETEVKFDYSVENQAGTSFAGKWKNGDIEMTPYRRILFIQGNKFNNIVQQVKQFIN